MVAAMRTWALAQLADGARCADHMLVCGAQAAPPICARGPMARNPGLSTVRGMAEAVIVAAARSPIGRAFKGSLRDMRPDDLAATVVRAALDQVPQLDPEAIDDLLLGCGQPGGESGFNLARVVAVRLGYDHLPGATITRYCSSSLQTTRMAMHAIRAGEGDVFISAGVETVSRSVKGNSDTLPDTENPVFDDAKARTATAAAGGGPVWHDPREDGALPDVYIAMGQTAENVAALRCHPRRAGRVRRPLAESRRAGDHGRVLLA
jgi:acetyl-CoA acetyltransferase